MEWPKSKSQKRQPKTKERVWHLQLLGIWSQELKEERLMWVSNPLDLYEKSYNGKVNFIYTLIKCNNTGLEKTTTDHKIKYLKSLNVKELVEIDYLWN